MKQVPNIFTLINLFLGCIAIVCVLQSGLTTASDSEGEVFFVLPERLMWAPVFIGLAAVIDFLDGFVARLFKAVSPMGKQLDSLADLVSFGVAPGMIVYSFLRYSYAHYDNGLQTPVIALLPAFLIPCSGAWRLARFNLDETQSTVFKGVPIPAVGLTIAAFPLIYATSGALWVQQALASCWFWYALTAALCWLMTTRKPMLSLKAAGHNKSALLILAALAIACAIFLHWLAVPVIFLLYVLLSLILKPVP